MTKFCKLCNLEKDISEFGTKQRKLKSSIKIYPSIYCKSCCALKTKLYRLTHKTKQNDIPKKKWLSNNLSKRKQYEKQYYLKNIDKFKQRSKINKKSRKAYKKKKLQDPIFRLRSNISNAVYKALKSKSNKSILKYLDYSINDLKYHLESQFDSNMNWSNYGSYWHLDHIIPQSDLPYFSMDDNNFKLCWALTNLRPLEANQNRKDGATRIRHAKNLL